MDSLKKRYVYKLSTNFVSLGFSIVTQSLIPRGLGPVAYGNFNYLTNFFSQLTGFLDMGMSTCFYTKLSRRPAEFGLTSFYARIFGIIALLTAAFIVVVRLSGGSSHLWPDQPLGLVWYAAVWGLLTWGVQILTSMADAYGVTVVTEIARILQRILGLVLIVLLFAFRRLNIASFFFYHYVILLVLGMVLVRIMNARGHSFRRDWALPWGKFKAYIGEFYRYSNPLFIYLLAGMVTSILDRWLLQTFAGSVEQGFFGLASQISTICFLFGSAMTPLLMREFSIAFGRGDVVQMAILFRRYIPMLYAIAAYFSCFLAVQADRIVFFLGGREFKGSMTAVAIMAFYPLLQTYGQMSGSVYYAMGLTKLFRNVGIFFMAIGLPLTYFLIAPSEKLGLNAGAMGLAIKTVVVAFLSINTLLYFNTRTLKLRFWYYFGHEIFSVISLVILALASTIGVDRLLGLSRHPIPSFLVAGVVYSALVLGLGIVVPSVFGLNKTELKNVLNSSLMRLRDGSNSPAEDRSQPK